MERLDGRKKVGIKINLAEKKDVHDLPCTSKDKLYKKNIVKISYALKSNNNLV